MFATSLAKEKCIAVSIYDLREFAAKEIFIAFIAHGIIFVDTLRANTGTITGNSKRLPWIIFVAVFAKTIVFVQTAFTNANNFAAMIENFPRFRSIIFALLTKFAVIVIAIVAEESVGNFVTAGNTQAVSSDSKNFEVMNVVVANGNLSVKVGVRPVGITSKTVTAGDVNAVFISTVFFSLPEVGNAFKFGEFALNQIAIKFGFSLSTASAAVSVI